MKNRPKVGVGLLLVKNEQILLGRRLNAHGDGEYGGPGGHLELGETIEECVRRELLEEAGPDIRIKGLRFLCFINMRVYMPKHYAHIHMAADWKDGEAKNMEPEVRESWDWFHIDDLPHPLFGTTEQAIEAYKTGKNFFEN
jgi:8-oxo-dGTP diphosphatase